MFLTCRLGGVLISKVVSDGLVDRWNQQQKAAGAAGSSRIKVGDRIIALNGDELKGDDLLERLKTFGTVFWGFLGLGMWSLGSVYMCAYRIIIYIYTYIWPIQYWAF